jgi:signal transduction histidine kinase
MPLTTLLLRRSGSWLATASRPRLAGIAAFLAVLSFFLTQALHWLFFPLEDLELLARRMAGDALAAIVIGVLTYRVMHGLNDRRRYTYERLQLIAALNHHIRNSLQVIQLSARTMHSDAALRQIDESVERIAGVLSELAPMAGEDPSQAA